VAAAVVVAGLLEHQSAPCLYPLASKLCGRHASSEMQACIKSNLDLNKFSATCATEFKNAAAAKKPGS
jgi:hypothetical protein